jgi:hypothetical protein
MVPPFHRKDTIGFLFRRKFPAVPLADLSTKPRPGGTTTLGRIVRHEEAKRYRDELESLPDHELQMLLEIEKAKFFEETQREEEARFFNQPHAAADFDHWSRAEHWSLEEAVALAMGKAPEAVSWSKIESYGKVSPFVQRYGRLRDLAQRAVPWKKLYDPVLPSIFLKWAEDNEIEIPAELREKVSRLKGKAADWKKNYDELWAMYNQHTADWKKVAEQQSALLKALQQKTSDLEEELSKSKAAQVAPETTKSQSPIERQNMLKVIFSMAAGGYGYKPEDKRSTVVAEIVSDVALQGIVVSDDTVRRYLNEARNCLPEWQDSSR